VHTDHLGGANVVTGEGGEVAEVSDYYPFGAPRIDDQVEGFVEQRKYIGEEYDAGVGLSYLNARHYDGARGQFLSQDPAHLLIGGPSFQQQFSRPLEVHLTDPQQLNSYSYARNNPLILKDPEDEAVPIFILLAVAAGIYWARHELGAVQDDYENGEVGKETLINYGVANGKIVVSAIGGEYAPIKWATSGVKVYENREMVSNFLSYVREELNKPSKSTFRVQTTPKTPIGTTPFLPGSNNDSNYLEGIFVNVPSAIQGGGQQSGGSLVHPFTAGVNAATNLALGADLTDPADFANAIRSIHECNSPWLAPKK
jgi:RHS repeat-associated protein